MAANVTRRGVLSAAGAGAAAATAGCFSRLRSRVAYTPAGQAELTIKCAPTDRDPSATAIARSLRDNLRAVGVDVTLELLGEEQLVRDALLNHEFDLAVVRVPAPDEPDELRSLLHSRFAEEEGWQNFPGVATRRLDALAERQRRPGSERAPALRDLQRALVREQPIVPVARRPYVTAHAPDVSLTAPAGLSDGLGYLVATPGDDPEQLDVAALTPELTVNRNLFGVEFRLRDRLLGLLYDQLARRIDGEYVPWLAESWSLADGDEESASADGTTAAENGDGTGTTEDGGGEATAADADGGAATAGTDSDTTSEDTDGGARSEDTDGGARSEDTDGGARSEDADAGTTSEAATEDVAGQATERELTVRLRPEAAWHDGTDLTAEDVAFTYRFLRDTALGETESPVPAPRFRSQSSLVVDAEAVDDRTVRLRLEGVRRSLVPHALTVPVLPEHEWRERSELGRGYFTQALLDDVLEPVGSGPLQFAEAVAEESVTFERNDDHFLRTASDLPEALAPFRNAPAYRRMVVNTSPNVSSALGNVANDGIDVVDGALPPRSVSSARDRDGVVVREEPPSAYYSLWCNCRRSPLSNYGFRVAVARLLDRTHLIETAFDGLAEPTETPLADPDLVPEDLAWDGTSAAGPFPGSDGEVDVEAARDLFREAGYRFQDGELLARQ